MSLDPRRVAAWLVLACAGCATPSRVLHVDDVVARMGIAWEIRGGALVVPGPRLAVVIAGKLRFVDPRDGQRFAGSWSGETHHAIFDGNELVVGEGIHAMTALDYRARERWRHVFEDDSQPGPLAARGEWIYAAIAHDDDTGAAHDELVAVRATTGDVEWRQPLSSVWRAVKVDAGVAICRPSDDFFSEDPTTGAILAIGFDAATGHLRWQHRVDAAHDAATDGRSIAIAGDGMLAIVDVSSGATSEVALPHQVEPIITIAGGTAYVAAAIGNGGVVSAIGLADRRIQWTRRQALPAAQLAVTEHGVFVLSTGAILHGMDRATGAARSEWGLSAPRSRVVAGPGDRLYVSDSAASMIAFSPVPVLPPVERAVVRGRVEPCGGPNALSVRVGDVDVTPAPDGRFEARVGYRGTVLVAATMSDGNRAATEIKFVGHERYNAGVLRLPKCRERASAIGH